VLVEPRTGHGNGIKLGTCRPGLCGSGGGISLADRGSEGENPVGSPGEFLKGFPAGKSTAFRQRRHP
jgi:hypothetical protein